MTEGHCDRTKDRTLVRFGRGRSPQNRNEKVGGSYKKVNFGKCHPRKNTKSEPKSTIEVSCGKECRFGVDRDRGGVYERTRTGRL